MQATLEQLHNIEFHDAGIEKITINFQMDTLELYINMLSIEPDNPTPAHLTFRGLSNFTIDPIATSEGIEINFADFKTTDGAGFSAQMILLLGFGLPSCELAFDFTDYTVAKL